MLIGRSIRKGGVHGQKQDTYKREVQVRQKKMKSTTQVETLPLEQEQV